MSWKQLFWIYENLVYYQLSFKFLNFNNIIHEFESY